MKIPVEGRPSLFRDSSVGTILVRNEQAKEEYKKRKAQLKEQMGLKQEINKMKSDIAEIREMLIRLVGKE